MSQGAKGETGPQGPQGPRGRAPAVLPGVFGWILLVLVLVMGAGNLLATYLDVQSSANSQKQEQQQAAAAGRQIVEKLCTSFGKLAELKPPAGNPRTNPSRAYDQDQHAILVGLGTDIGCHK